MPAEDKEHFSALALSRVGTILRGKYHLDAVLGVGGMAVVYKATHRNRAQYAVKMLLPEHSTSDSVRRRFLREGYAANSVKHSGAVRIVDDDVSEDGVAFLVLELLDGMACDRLASASGGRLPMNATCAVILQVLDVLEAAHGQGIVHRDIKPGNLFVLRDGAVKVLDFGIARVRDSMTGNVQTTSVGVLLGTPAFMAPEQALGETGDIDARADIWAVGASAFALASGAPVHEGDSRQRLLVQLLTQSARSLAAADPGAPPAIVKVVDRALLFDRDRRWPSAQAMRTALEEASRLAFGELPSREALASLIASVDTQAPDPADPKALASMTPPSSPEALRITRDASTLPEAAKAVVETSRPVSRDGHSSHPPRRFQRFAVAVFAACGVSLAATGVVLFPKKVAMLDRTATAPDGPWQRPAEVAPPAGTATTLAGSVETVIAPTRSFETSTSPQDGGRAIASSPSASRLPMPKGPPGQQARAYLAVAGAPSDAGSGEPAVSEDAGPTPNCKPPFYYDSQWNRVFKRECLQ